MKEIKACFFDLDGTLVRSDHSISPSVIEAVQRLERQGIAPVIATGRSYEALLPIKDKLGIKSPVIAYNGAMIVDGKDGSIMTHHTLPEEESRKIIKIARELDYFLLAYRDGELIYEKKRTESEEYCNRINIKGKLINFDDLSILNLTKFIIINDHEKLNPVQDRILENYGEKLNAFFSDSRFLEIVPAGIDKGKAVEEVMRLLGGTVDQTMAFGDGFNDLPMLESVRWGIVMENGLPELKKLFPPERTAPSCEEDGVVTYLADFFKWD